VLPQEFIINHVPNSMGNQRLQRINMKITFTQILALIACALLTACGAGSCVGHNGCGDSATTSSTTSGVVSTLAGDSSVTAGGYADGTGTAALFNGPHGMAVDSSGNVYVADTANQRIRKITAAGVVTTFAGNSISDPFTNGTGTAATFASPIGIAIDSSGNLFVIEDLQRYTVGVAFGATQFGSTVRKITPAGVVTTFAGSSTNTGSSDGTGTAALFSRLAGIAIDSSNNLYVTDRDTFTIRKITPAGVVTTFAGTDGTNGYLDGTGTAAQFISPEGITIDSSGNLYVVDGASIIRKITSAGVVTTLAGTINQEFPYANGTGTAATFSAPIGITVDSSGNLYVTESDRQTIRKITSAGVVTTYAGLEDTVGTTDGTLTNARFSRPYGITIDSSGNLFISDFASGNNNIRKITP